MRIVLIHDDPGIVHELPGALRTMGYDVAVFTDPIEGWDYLKASTQLDALITRVAFPNAKPTGVALARLASAHRTPWILFVALTEWAEQARKLGEFMPLGTPTSRIVSLLTEKLGRPERSGSHVRITPEIL